MWVLLIRLCCLRRRRSRDSRHCQEHGQAQRTGRRCLDEELPGDDVLGFIDDHNRIIVHKRRCPVAAKLKSGFGNRLLAVKWEPGKSIYFPVYLYIKGIDNIGILNRVTQIISGQLNVNIHRLTIGTNDGIFEGRIEMFVHNSDDVKEIQNSLKKITEIKTVTRIDQFDAVPK